MYRINEFKSLFVNRKTNLGNHKTGGGIAIYIREKINHTEFSLNSISFESLQLQLNINNEIITLLAIYRPPSQNVNTFLIELEQITKKIKNKCEMIIIGDMNIDLNKLNLTTTKYLEMLSSYGLECMITESTRDIKENTSTCIHHLFMRCSQKTQINAWIVATTTSDHYSIFCSVNKEISQRKQTSEETGARKIISNKVIERQPQY